MASNMYLDPAFSSLAASTGGSKGTDGASLPSGANQVEIGLVFSMVSIPQGVYQSRQSSNLSSQVAAAAMAIQKIQTSSGSWAGILRGCLLQRRRMQ